MGLIYSTWNVFAWSRYVFRAICVVDRKRKTETEHDEEEKKQLCKPTIARNHHKITPDITQVTSSSSYFIRTNVTALCSSFTFLWLIHSEYDLTLIGVSRHTWFESYAKNKEKKTSFFSKAFGVIRRILCGVCIPREFGIRSLHWALTVAHLLFQQRIGN